MLMSLFQFAPRWSLLPEDVQYNAFDILNNMLQCTPLERLTGVFVKCILIQLTSSTVRSMSCVVQVSVEETLSLLVARSSKPPVLTAIEVMQLLKCLIMYEENKQVFLEQGIMDLLTSLVEDDSTQQYATELIYSLMTPASTDEDSPESQKMASPIPNTSHDTGVSICETVLLRGWSKL